MMRLTNTIGRSSSPLGILTVLLVALFLCLVSVKGVHAHFEGDFCEAGATIDRTLCQQLAAADSENPQETTPLLDEEGNVRSPIDTATMYLKIGVQHILPGGTDHILFVLALFLASERLRSLIIQITAFTLAHTATLGLAAAGVIQPPASIVEPLIAFSIAFVAIENLFFNDISKWRPLVVFGFGLLHGLGFAGFIRDVGLPPEQFWSSLIGFNIGVELGQLSVVAAAALASVLIKRGLARTNTSYRSIVVIPASLVIAAIGLWWAVARTFGI